MSAGDIEGYSQGDAAQRDPDARSLTIETIEDVEPLDEQFGVEVPKTVPDALYDTLFGQPKRGEVKLGDRLADARVFTYVILDAAKVVGLPEMLEASGLEHRCLFKGAAYDELKGVAPWIVRLEEGNTFTRNLFTRSDAPWHFWDKEAGLYIRSRDKLVDVHAHWRKFTKVQDEAGAWFYLRLYDPRITQAFLHNAPDFADRILSRAFPWDDLTIITCFEGRVKSFRAAHKTSKNIPVIRLGADEKAVLRHLTFEARADGLMAKLDKSTVIAMPTEPRLRKAHKETIVAALHRIHGYGFQQPIQQEKWGIWEMFYGEEFERGDPQLVRICDAKDMPSGDRFAVFQRRLEEIYS